MKVSGEFLKLKEKTQTKRLKKVIKKKGKFQGLEKKFTLPSKSFTFLIETIMRSNLFMKIIIKVC